MKLFLAACLLSVSTFSLAAGNATNGAKLYKKCISCHGKDGMGKKSQKAPMIAGQHDWYVEDQIKQIRDKKRNTKNTRKMYPFVKKLSDKDIKDLAAYISKMK